MRIILNGVRVVLLASLLFIAACSDSGSGGDSGPGADSSRDELLSEFPEFTGGDYQDQSSGSDEVVRLYSDATPEDIDDYIQLLEDEGYSQKDSATYEQVIDNKVFTWEYIQQPQGYKLIWKTEAVTPGVNPIDALLAQFPKLTAKVTRVALWPVDIEDDWLNDAGYIQALKQKGFTEAATDLYEMTSGGATYSWFVDTKGEYEWAAENTAGISSASAMLSIFPPFGIETLDFMELEFVQPLTAEQLSAYEAALVSAGFAPNTYGDVYRKEIGAKAYQWYYFEDTKAPCENGCTAWQMIDKNDGK